MIPVTSNDFKEYLVWAVALVIAVLGFSHARSFIVFVLDKLYQIFIQNNPNAV